MHILPLVFTLFFALAHALDILIPEWYDLNITANSAFPITLRDRSAPGGPVRVYLATTPPGSGTNPVCVLEPSVATVEGTDRTSVNVTIPANIGSQGRYYSISASPVKRGRSTGFYYSTRFSVAGMAGNFTDFEKKWSVGDSETLRCESYDCARGCSDRIVKPVLFDRNDATGSEKEKAWAEEKTCIQNECPGAFEGAATAVVGGGVWKTLVVAAVVVVGVVVI